MLGRLLRGPAAMSELTRLDALGLLEFLKSTVAFVHTELTVKNVITITVKTVCR